MSCGNNGRCKVWHTEEKCISIKIIGHEAHTLKGLVIWNYEICPDTNYFVFFIQNNDETFPYIVYTNKGTII